MASSSLSQELSNDVSFMEYDGRKWKLGEKIQASWHNVVQRLDMAKFFGDKERWPLLQGEVFGFTSDLQIKKAQAERESVVPKQHQH